MIPRYHTPLFQTTGHMACSLCAVDARTGDLVAKASRGWTGDARILGRMNAGETSALVARCVR